MKPTKEFEKIIKEIDSTLEIFVEENEIIPGLFHEYIINKNGKKIKFDHGAFENISSEEKNELINMIKKYIS